MAIGNTGEQADIYRALFENGTAISLLVDPRDGSIVDANRRACEYYQYSHDEITTMRIQQINTLTPEQIRTEMEAAVAEDRNHFVFSHRKKSGEVRHVEVYSSPVMLGGSRRLHSVVFDIEDKYRAEEALAREQRQLRSVLDDLPVGIYVADPSTFEILYVNPYFQDLYGRDITGKRCYEVIHDRTSQCPFCNNPKLRPDGSVMEWDYHNPVLDRDFYVMDRLIRWQDGRDARFEVAIDITERKRTEETLRKLNETKEKILSVLAHDLRSPFATMLSLLGLLGDGERRMGPDQTAELVEELRISTENTYDLVQNLLEWSRSHNEEINLNRTEFSLRETVDSVFAVLGVAATRKQIELTHDIDRSIRLVADRDMIETVVRNLVSNAIKFTPTGGSVVVEAEEVEAEAPGTGWRILVRDTGVGMSAETIERLFSGSGVQSTRGTRNERGLGLGLSICRDFVAQHDGTIRVSSIENEGSTFTVFLPRR